MRTSISKKLLAGALSVMMVLSLVAPTGAQAASKYSITKKASITAEKTNTYTIKGVKKAQYVKMTYKNYKGIAVKYNGETVTKSLKIYGGKNIKLKVTAPDKVAKYNAKVTFKVYNKGSKKAVKTLKIKSAVKVTELKVLSVEKASTTGKYLVAYFNKALTELKVADVTVREKSTGIMLGVESVALASDGKSATIALVGSENTQNGQYYSGTVNQFVKVNRDYTFTVSQNGVSATTDFTVDAVWADAVVTQTDAAKKTIWIGQSPLTVPDKITVDYEEILGRTVTVWYDKNNEITKLVTADEKVVYGSFATVVDDTKNVAYLVDQATGEKYYTYDSDEAQSIYPTCLIDRTTNNGSQSYYFGHGATDKLVFDYAKLVMNKNNTIREIVAIKNWAAKDARLVTKVEGNIVYTGKTELSLKDYTIVKDGKTASLSEIKENDVIFYNVAGKFAEIYTKSVTGDLTAVYSDSFAFAGKTYKLAGERYATSYAGATKKAATAEYMESLKAGKEQITVYFDRTGMPVYVSGKTAEVKTSDVEIILTGAAQTYNQSLKDYIQLTGYNAETLKKVTYDIDVTELETITNGGGVTFTVGKVVDKDAATAKYQKKVEKFAAAPAANGKFANAATDAINVTIAGEGAFDVSTVEYNTAGTDIVAGAGNGLTGEMVAGESVTVTLNEAGKVVGLCYADGETVTSVDTFNNFSSTDKAFNNTYKSINGYQVTSSVPVFVVETDGTVTVCEYGKFNRQIASLDTNAADVMIYQSKNKVYEIVVKGTNLEGNAQDGEAFKGVVVSYKMTSDSKNSAELVAVVGEEIKTYTAFKENVTAALALGDIVEITPNRDGSVINGLAKVTVSVQGAYEQKNATAKQFTVAGTALAMASGTTTIVKIDKTNPSDVKVVPVSFAELEGTTNVVSVSYLTGTTALVDVVVLEATTVEQFRREQEESRVRNIALTAVATLANTYNTEATAQAEITRLLQAQHAGDSVTVTVTFGTFTAATSGHAGSISYTYTVTGDYDYSKTSTTLTTAITALP